jgi:SCP-2 sterol transfer family
VPIDVSAPPARVYAQVEALEEDEFETLMADPATREPIIDALVAHFAGTYRGDDDVDAVIHVKLWDRPGGGYDERELVLSGGRCTASDQLTHDKPRMTLKVRPSDLRKIVTGEAGPRRLALKGRLRVLGDIRFGMKLQDLFDL